MCVCVRVCVCVCACMHACVSACMHTCMCACMRACARACIHNLFCVLCWRVVGIVSFGVVVVLLVDMGVGEGGEVFEQ